MNKNNRRALRDFAIAHLLEVSSNIVRPSVNTENFVITLVILQMIPILIQFGGLPNDDLMRISLIFKIF